MEKILLLVDTKILLMTQKTHPLFSSFTQAKRRDEILQLLKKQREERIMVRLIVCIWINISGWRAVNCGKFSEIDPLNLDTQGPEPFIYQRGAVYRHQIIWQSLVNQRYLHSVPSLMPEKLNVIVSELIIT